MFTRVLYPTDFSTVSEHAQQYVVRLKETGAEKVVVLHVVEVAALAAVAPIYAADVEPFLQRVVDQFRDAGLDARYEVRTGVPAREIVAAADDVDASLIVMGSHGRSQVAEILLGSVTEGVLRRAHVPVLVVTPKDRA